MIIDIDKDKIKRIENYLNQVKQERYSKSNLGIIQEIELDGKIIGLKIALSILKDEI